MKPYLAWTCGINWECEMRDIPVTLSQSTEPQACCDEECGWFEILIEPIKTIPVGALPYHPEHDPDRAVIEARHERPGRLVVIPAGRPYLVAPASWAGEEQDYYDLFTAETFVLALASLNDIVLDGSLCQLKKTHLQPTNASRARQEV